MVSRASHIEIASISLSRNWCLSNVTGQSMQEQLASGVTRTFVWTDLLATPVCGVERMLRTVANVLASSKQRLHLLQIPANEWAAVCAVFKSFIADTIAFTGSSRQSWHTAARDRELATHFRPHREHLSLPKKEEIIMVFCLDLVDGQK